MRLHLVSPHMKSEQVKRLQALLKTHDFLQGAVDGEYGPNTARAVYRAKYWLGYLNPDQSCGDLLYGLLNGTKKQTLVMKALTAKRKRAVGKETRGFKLVKESFKYLGETEHPADSNKSRFSLWYGVVGAWCAMFCSFIGVKGGSKVFKKGHFYAYVPYVVGDAKMGRNNLAITYIPKTGDMPCYDWDGDGIPDHIGFYINESDMLKINSLVHHRAVLDFGNLRPGEFWAIEGNTSVGNDSNGGKVMIRKRSKSQVQAYVHIGA